MTRHKAIAFVCLALAFALVVPTGAIAAAGGTDRPVEGTGSGSVIIDTSSIPSEFSGEVTGVVSHFGNLTVQLEGEGAPTPTGGFVGSGTATIIAPNGDEVTGTFTLNAPGGGEETIVVMTIDGGTGRFADATGTLTVVCHTGPPDFNGNLILLPLVECAVSGRISY